MKVGVRDNIVAIIYTDEKDFYKTADEVAVLAEDFMLKSFITTTQGNTDIIVFPSPSEALGFIAEVSSRYSIKHFIHSQDE